MYFLSLTQWSIIQLTQNILVSRTDDAATLEVEFFDAMGSPTHDTRHSKNRGINLLWKTNHLIDETAIEVEVGTGRLAAATMLLQALDTLLLNKLQKVVLILPTLLSLASSPARRFNSTARGSLKV